MSGDATISGLIRIDPPVAWAELAELYDQPWAIGQEADHYPDVVMKVDTVEEHASDGVFRRHSGVAIVPTGNETSACHLLAQVRRITRHILVAPDGTRRTFTGFLHVVWGGGESVYRVVVDADGKAVEVRPQVVWPEGARDEDSADLEPRLP